MLRKFRILAALSFVFGSLGFAAQGCSVSAAVGDSCSADSDCDGACDASGITANDVCVGGVCGCSAADECSVDADCPTAGDVCDAGVCVPSGGECSLDSDCADLCDGAVCDMSTNTCDISGCTTGGCTVDTDCPCDDGVDNGTCDTTTGDCDTTSCPSGGCTVDTDCDTGETCDTSTGDCVSASGPDCDCACTNTLAMNGCSDVCTMGLNGTTNPNFCDGSPALTQCTMCLEMNCGFAASDAADPTTCSQ